MDEFYNFQSTALGVMQLFLILAIGFILSVRKTITPAAREGLNNILLWACLPSLIITKISVKFNPAEEPMWWVLPLLALAIAGLGLTIGRLLGRLLGSFTALREFTLAVGFQNCVYLPMTLVAFVCSTETCNELLVQIFLFSLGFNLSVWPFGVAYLKGHTEFKSVMKSVLNPPALSTIFAIVFALIFGNQWIPEFVAKPVRFLGDASFPLALILLGASLAMYRGYHVERIKAMILCLLGKLIVLPALVLMLLHMVTLNATLEFVCFLQALMPSAVSLVVIGEYTKADNRFTSGIIFYSHLVAVITIPSWLLLYSLLAH